MVRSLATDNRTAKRPVKTPVSELTNQIYRKAFIIPRQIGRQLKLKSTDNGFDEAENMLQISHCCLLKRVGM